MVRKQQMTEVGVHLWSSRASVSFSTIKTAESLIKNRDTDVRHLDNKGILLG